MSPPGSLMQNVVPSSRVTVSAPPDSLAGSEPDVQGDVTRSAPSRDDLDGQTVPEAQSVGRGRVRQDALIEIDVIANHPGQREALLHGRAASSAVEDGDATDGIGQVVLVATQEPGDAVIDDLGRGPGPVATTGVPLARASAIASPKLGPGDRVDQRLGVLQELEPHRDGGLDEHLVVGGEHRFDDRLEVVDL